MIIFRYLQKEEFNKQAEALFNILHDNMNLIAPTGKTKEADYLFWCEIMREEISNDSRHIILALEEDTQTIIGFFQYVTIEDVLVMEQIQIMPAYQGEKGVFRGFYDFLLSKFKDVPIYVEANADRRNQKSICILNKLGLSVIGENKTGISFCFRGKYADLLKWHRGK